jgi:hypothetical protein
MVAPGQVVALLLEHPGGMPLANLPKRYRQVQPA